MSFEKNTALIDPICRVEIQSVQGEEFPDLEEVYTTPSSIRFTNRNTVNAGGYLASNKLVFTYPGTDTQFYSKLRTLLSGTYIVNVITTTKKIFEISNSNSPMRVKADNFEDTTTIEFNNEDFNPPRYVGQDSFGIFLASTLTFNLA